MITPYAGSGLRIKPGVFQSLSELNFIVPLICRIWCDSVGQNMDNDLLVNDNVKQEWTLILVVTTYVSIITFISETKTLGIEFFG